MDGFVWSMVCGQWSVFHGPWSMIYRLIPRKLLHYLLGSSFGFFPTGISALPGFFGPGAGFVDTPGQIVGFPRGIPGAGSGAGRPGLCWVR